jgi:hypothetical protein
MSQDHDARAKLAKLADVLMQDIITTPDAEIVAEVGKEGIERARALFAKAKQEILRQQLLKAKAESNAWKSTRTKDLVSFDRTAARVRFDKIRSGDTEFDRKMTIAARSGEAPTDADIDGVLDDWADLQRLDGKDEPK